MPKVSLSTLRRDVVDAAKYVARETLDEHRGDTPAEGTSVIVTERDVRLWKAALRLLKWEADRARRAAETKRRSRSK